MGPALTCVQVCEGLPAGPIRDRLAGSDFSKGWAHKGNGHVNCKGKPWGVVGTVAKWQVRVLSKWGGRSPCETVVAVWACAPSVLRASHFPKEATHLAFEKCEVCPSLNVGLLTLKHSAGQTKHAGWLRRAGGAARLQAPIAGRDEECWGQAFRCPLRGHPVQWLHFTGGETEALHLAIS